MMTGYPRVIYTCHFRQDVDSEVGDKHVIKTRATKHMAWRD